MRAIFAGILVACLAFGGQAKAAPTARAFDTIAVQGNERFRDQDVIVSSGLETGVVLNEYDLVAAAEALEFTGEFKSVRIISRGKTLIIIVDEQPEYTGGLTFGLGYDSDDGILGAVGFGLTDLWFPGSKIRGDLQVAQETQSLALGISAPTFWGATRSGGVRASIRNFDYDNDAFAYTDAFISPYLNLTLGDSVAAELRYTLGWDRIYDVNPGASNIIFEERGERISSGVGFSIITGSDLRQGDLGLGRADWSVRLDQDVTGLGGDTELSTTRVSFYGRTPIGGSGFALRSRIELGNVTSLGGDDPTAADRYFLGGATLRGFERGTISPYDLCAGCGPGGSDLVTKLGGNQYAVARTDLIVPLLRDYPTIETFVFYDIGSSWSLDTDFAASGTLVDGQSFRSSTGIGVSFETQLGTFEGYFALDINGDAFDKKQEFGLTFRSVF
jgi:outer membrane protein insertion porin family